MWQLCFIRFLVAMGIGGEWAVGASLVAETFPQLRRGPTFSGMCSLFECVWNLDGNFGRNHSCRELALRILIGILPAFLTFVVMARCPRPEQWQQRQRNCMNRPPRKSGLGVLKNCSELKSGGAARAPGCALAAVGLATFWGVMVAGRD